MLSQHSNCRQTKMQALARYKKMLSQRLIRHQILGSRVTVFTGPDNTDLEIPTLFFVYTHSECHATKYQPGMQYASYRGDHSLPDKYRPDNNRRVNTDPVFRVHGILMNLVENNLIWSWRFVGRCRGTLATLARLAHCGHN
ncbi:hypothetical protein MSG28_012934 [Choristoneura fumiferana]|uniref:Uncharacterized protein n=1 Tax=Choristoneura fumiferana TaxID=7141 RepID=A0ACC0KRB6_CHOFU|nr:hypothetical protein MSG28_012934 [Choristoneura fumiferana]